MAVDDVFKLIIGISLYGEEVRPGLHFQSRVELNTAADLVASWRSSSEAAMLAAMTNQLTLHSYMVEDKLPGVLATYTAQITPALPGLNLNPGVSPQDAVVFAMKSALKSKRARGRVYWPGATEIGTAGGELVAPDLALWQALATAMTTSYVGTTPPSGWRLVTFSPEDLTAPKAPPVFKPRPGVMITPVTVVLPDVTVRSQRRRQRRIGQ